MESPQSVYDQLRSGSRVALAQAITLIESQRPEDLTAKKQLLNLCFETDSPSIRIAISGSPGVGKSTFIEHLGLHLTQSGKRVAVLAIDPSSDVSGGSILGDKTRMEKLSTDQHAFIRPSPSSGVLGGVAEMTRETIIVCEAAGFDVIIIETVGVGQAEYGVYTMTDLFVLLTAPGAGDVLQGIKRGIMEKADIVFVNKADGDLRDSALRTAADIRNALMMTWKAGNRKITVLTTSSISGEGAAGAWSALTEEITNARSSGAFDERRSRQKEQWFRDAIMYQLKNRLKNDDSLSALENKLLMRIRTGATHPIDGAGEYVSAIFSTRDD